MSKKVNVSPDIDWDVLASASEGYSGADLQAVIYNAHLDVVHRTLEEKRVGGDKKGKRKGKCCGRSSAQSGKHELWKVVSS